MEENALHIDLKAPASWQEVTKEHLAIIASLMNEQLSREEMLFVLFCRFTGIRHEGHGVFVTSDNHRIRIETWQLDDFCNRLAWVMDEMPCDIVNPTHVNSYLDDITFYAKARNPFDGVDVNAAGGCLTEIELKTLAAMTGVDALAGIRRLELNGCDGEPYDAALTCIRLGITPKAVERTHDGECARLYFQNPTVTITGADFSARTITGRVVAAEGTAVAAPPMPYMFGLTEIYNLGTDYEGRNEYGNAFSHGADGFTLDLSDYMKSNGVFTLCFPEWVAPGDKPAFFRVELKEYGHK